MHKPIICFDFDGTLVAKNGRIHPRDVEILQNEDRVIFLPATGRPLHAVRHAFHQNGLFVEQTIPFPMILQNGAVIYRANELLLTTSPIAAQTRHALLDIVQRYSRITCLAFSPNQVHALLRSESGQAMIERFALNAVPLLTADRERPYTKISFVADDPAPLHVFAEETAVLSLERFFSLPTVLEMTPPGVDKGSGLIHLLDALDWQAHNVIAAGDGENDLPLFTHAAVSFCAHDAPEHIRAAADQIIDIGQNGLLAPILEDPLTAISGT